MEIRSYLLLKKHFSCYLEMLSGKSIINSNFHTILIGCFFFFRVAVLDKVADYLLLIGKLVVTAFMGLATFFYFTKGYESDLNFLTPPDINYIWVPVVVSLNIFMKLLKKVY